LLAGLELARQGDVVLEQGVAWQSIAVHRQNQAADP